MRVVPAVVSLLLLATAALAGPYENGTKDTPGKRLPPGTYSCSMGSYAVKACTVEERQGRFFLVVTGGARFPFELELYPTDEADQLIGQGRLTAPGELCPTCADDVLGTECAGNLEEKRACPAQPITISLRRNKKGVWAGELMYYLVRGSYDGATGALKDWYRLGITDELRIGPAKKK